jgi:hypothetical protein
MDIEFLNQIERARNMTGNDKVSESLQIFERTSHLMLAGIRAEFPELNEKELLQRLYERLDINRQMEAAATSQ